MAIVVGFLVSGLVITIAAAFVIREAGRIASEPPPALFDPDDAFDWVVQHVPDDVAATLTEDDVHRILDAQLEYFRHRGVSANGSTSTPEAPALVGGAEQVAYILERCAGSGEAYLPQQVHAVVETQLTYLRAIGAIGPPACPDEDPGKAPGS